MSSLAEKSALTRERGRCLGAKVSCQEQGRVRAGEGEKGDRQEAVSVCETGTACMQSFINNVSPGLVSMFLAEQAAAALFLLDIKWNASVFSTEHNVYRENFSNDRR